MAKDLLFHNPVLRHMLNWVEAFPVRRASSDVRALRESLRRLKRGMPVLVFPEGTRQTNEAERKTQSGIGFLALKAKVPVLPVHIGGSGKVLPPGAKIPRRNRVTVAFGKPLTFSENLSYPEIVSAIMQEIQSLAPPGESESPCV